MIPAREVELRQKTGRALAQTGIEGSIEVEVPLLDDAAWSFGKVHLMDALKGFESAFDANDRKALIDQAILSLDNFYVHRDLKWAKHAVDAGCALRSLRRTCDRLGDAQFHQRVSAILKSLRDIHTVYILPEPYRRLVAFLPFTMAVCRDGEGDAAPERFLATRLLPGFLPKHFTVGCEILTWNGLPIGTAVREAGERECAANDAAQVALGVRLMTIRWLGTSTFPPANWVTLGYLDAAKRYREMRLSWRLLELRQDSDLILPIQAVWKLEDETASPQATQAALDQRSLVEEGTVQQMFESVASVMKAAAPTRTRPLAKRTDVIVPRGASPYFSAEAWRTTIDGQEVDFGHLHIHSFHAPSPEEFVDKFRKLLLKMPPDFLLLDVRSNPGGDLNAAECIVQFLTPREVEPLPFQFRATRTLERFVSNDGGVPQADNGPWVDRVADSVANGQQYSRPGPLTERKWANHFGQEYYGTVGLLFDAITYSSGDIFTAQFADLEVGPLLGVDPRTGGGGGNMVFHGTVAGLAPEALGVRALPKGARLHFAIRRCLRNGRESGELIEEVGIPAEHVLPVSSDDLLTGDRDLMHRAAGHLHAARRRRFEASIELSGAQARITVLTDPQPADKPLSLFVHLDGRPDRTVKTENGRAEILIDRVNYEQELRISVYELRSYSYMLLKREPLAVYTRRIPKLGEA